MDISKLALTRVDELERRVAGMSSSKTILSAFEMRNDYLYEYVSNTNKYTHAFLPFTAKQGSMLTLIFTADFSVETECNCNILLYTFGAPVVALSKTLSEKTSININKTITVFEEIPCEVVLEIVGENLKFTLEKYSLNIIGNVVSAPDGVLSPSVSADYYNADDLKLDPYKPPKPQDPPPPEKEPIIEAKDNYGLAIMPTVILPSVTSILTDEQIWEYSQIPKTDD